MGQTKKKLLKKTLRQCSRMNRRVSRVVYQRRDHDIADQFGLIWGDAREHLLALQAMHSSALERSEYVLKPVTYQNTQAIYDRLNAFFQQILPS